MFYLRPFLSSIFPQKICDRVQKALELYVRPSVGEAYPMTSKSVATALTLYRARTLTLEQAATVGGCSTAQLEESARAFAPAAGHAPADD
jgi:hypothetical protein